MIGQYVGIGEISRILGVSPNTVRARIKDASLPYHQATPRSRRRFSIRAVETWWESLQRPAASIQGAQARLRALRGIKRPVVTGKKVL